jgi:hypothetical protein
MDPRASDPNIAATHEWWTAFQRFSRDGMYSNM